MKRGFPGLRQYYVIYRTKIVFARNCLILFTRFINFFLLQLIVLARRTMGLVCLVSTA